MSPSLPSSSIRRRLAALAVAAIALLAGCGEQAQKFAEPRDVGDKVTDGDLETFFQVIDELPEKKLPEMPALFKSPPAWDEQRTLPVNELVREEFDELDKLWNDEHLTRHLAKDRPLQKALRQRMSAAQFVGLVKTIGAALARNAVRPDQELKRIVEQGKRRLNALRAQTQRFNQLQPDERHVVLTTAVWITRIDRARRLMEVPPENLAQVKAHYDRLKTIFPPEFWANPFDSIADQIEELGMSFEELRQTGLDTEIDWKETDALRGMDPPDPDPREIAVVTPTKMPQPVPDPGQK
ncbi:MAG TPA: hypothetical protein VGP63_22020 [Planctomycetaceae bacterium]|jgi:hypothetical protein|nr:hypothetical protein [Planctomycetaceae bacterium]